MQKEGAYPARPPPHPESHHTCLDPPRPPNSVMEKQLGRHLPGSLLGTRPDPRTDTCGVWRGVGVQSPATSQLTRNPDPRGRRAIDSKSEEAAWGRGLLREPLRWTGGHRKDQAHLGTGRGLQTGELQPCWTLLGERPQSRAHASVQLVPRGPLGPSPVPDRGAAVSHPTTPRGPPRRRETGGERRGCPGRGCTPGQRGHRAVGPTLAGWGAGESQALAGWAGLPGARVGAWGGGPRAAGRGGLSTAERQEGTVTVLGQGPLPAQGVLDPDPAVSGHLYSGKAGGVRRWGAKEGAGVSPRGSSSPLPGFPANTASGNRARDPPASAASCRPRAPPAPPRLPAQAQPPEKGVGGGTERSWGLEPRACSRTSSASAPSRRRLAPAVGFVGGGPLQPPHPRTLRGQHARWTQEPQDRKSVV